MKTREERLFQETDSSSLMVKLIICLTEKNQTQAFVKLISWSVNSQPRLQSTSTSQSAHSRCTKPALVFSTKFMFRPNWCCICDRMDQRFWDSHTISFKRLTFFFTYSLTIVMCQVLYTESTHLQQNNKCT